MNPWVRRLLRLREEGLVLGLQRVQHRVREPRRKAATQRWLEKVAGRWPTDTEFFGAFGQKPPRGTTQLREVTDRLDSTLRRRFLPSVRDARTARAVAEHVPGAVEATLQRADDVMAGRLSWLVPAHPDGEWPPDWHVALGGDGASWPLQPSWELDAEGPGRPGDVRLTWEVGRHQFLCTLARAYLHTGDERYALAAMAALQDFMRCCPFGLGIHWMHSQEAALRLKTWLWVLATIAPARGIDPEERLAVHKGLWLHAELVHRTLSDGPVTHNHLLTELAGLSHFALVFPFFRLSQSIGTQSLQRFEQEIVKQFWEDGAPGEGSTNYHLFVLESAIELYAHCRHLKQPPSERWRVRLRTMLDFAMTIVRPDGSFPRIGDADDGRGFRLTDVGDGRDRRGPVLAGALLTRTESVAAALPRLYEEAFWLIGPEASAVRARFLRHGSLPPARLFPRSGIAVMRSFPRAGQADNHVVVAGGPCAVRPGVSVAHLHAHALSVVWWRHGREVLVDPGTFLYCGDAALRRTLRRTSAHTTLQAGNRDHFDVSSQRFGVQGLRRSRVIEWEAGPGWHVVGFRVPAAPDGPEEAIWLERHVLWRMGPDYLLLFDAWQGEGTSVLRQWFQVGGLGAVERGPRHVTLTEGDEEVVDLLEVHGTHAATLEHTVGSEGAPGPGWYAPHYGAGAPGTAVCLVRRDAALPARSIVYVGPLVDGGPALTDRDGVSAVMVPLGDGHTDHVLLQAGRPWALESTLPPDARRPR